MLVNYQNDLNKVNGRVNLLRRQHRAGFNKTSSYYQLRVYLRIQSDLIYGIEQIKKIIDNKKEKNQNGKNKQACNDEDNS